LQVQFYILLPLVLLGVNRIFGGTKGEAEETRLRLLTRTQTAAKVGLAIATLYRIRAILGFELPVAVFGPFDGTFPAGAISVCYPPLFPCFPLKLCPMSSAAV
jgi:hypothetical protein